MKYFLLPAMLMMSLATGPAMADTQATVEKAFLCNATVAPQTLKKIMLKDGVISGRGSDNGSLFKPAKPFSILGFPVKSFTFDGEDDTDFHGISTDLGADIESVKKVLVERKVKLKKVKKAMAFASQTEFGRFAVVKNPKNSDTSISCGEYGSE